MKTHPTPKSPIIIYAIINSLLALSGRAEEIFSYGSTDNYVTSNVNFAEAANASVGSSGTYIFKNAFRDVNTLSPSTSNYTGPIFYGGYQFSSSTINTGLNRQQIRNNASSNPSTDQIYLQAYNSGGWPGSILSMHGVYLFKQEDFNSEYQTGPVDITGMSVEWKGYGNADPSGASYNATGRFLVQIGGAYYVSESTFSLQSNGSFSLDDNSLLSERWAQYNPSFSLNFNQSTAYFSQTTLNGVTAVGVYFEDDFWTGTSTANSAFGLGFSSFSVENQIWRTDLYRSDWTPTPAISFEQDEVIQDFSYAGYAHGEEAIPNDPFPIINAVTQHNADPTGQTDSTIAIQNAINAVPTSGGIVYLPEGTYLVSPIGTKPYSLKIAKSNVVLRGDGPDRTCILNTSYDMHNKVIIYAFSLSAARWKSLEPEQAHIAQDLMGPTVIIPVDDTTPFDVGDTIIIRSDASLAWVQEHGEALDWGNYLNEIGSIMYFRTIVGIDDNRSELEIDIPTRYYLKTRDNPIVYKKTGLISEVGIEDLSIGNVEHPGSDGWWSKDFVDPTKSAYSANGSYAITMLGVDNGWIRNVDSFSDSSNTTGTHILSNGIRIRECSAVSVVNCYFRMPQYGGGGGNGYMFRVENSNDCLVSQCTAEYSRHGLSIAGMACAGNVFYKCLDRDTGHQVASISAIDNTTGGKGSDHHMWFSHSNLFDNCIAEESWFEARDRFYIDMSHPKHNATSAHSVFWNTEGRSNTYNGVAVWSQQARYGYVIGTRGIVSNVRVNGTNPSREYIFLPVDRVEGNGEGDDLSPASLYDNQLAKRLGN